MSPPYTMEVTQLPLLVVLHRCDYHHSLHSKEVNPDVQNDSDQSCLQVRQENTQTAFKTPHPVTALSDWVMHATGLQETAPIRKHNSIQQKVAKLSLDWSRRFNFKLTILLSSEAGSAGIIWFPAAPLQMMAISIPISGWWFYFPHEFLQVIPDSQKSAYSLRLHWADGSWSEISAGAGGQQAAKNPHPGAADCSDPGDSSLLTTTDRWQAQQCHRTCPGLSAA